MNVAQIGLAVALSAAVAAAAVRVRALSFSGGVAAAIVGIIVFGLGGAPFAAPLLAFFITSSLLTALSSRVRGVADDGPGARTGPRSATQVIANGGAPTILVICMALTPPTGSPLTREWLLFYVGALAAMNADTWSTELGGLWRGRPRLVTSFKPVEAGTSGAVSWPGLLAALIGSTVVAAACAAAWPARSPVYLWRPDLAELMAVVWAGFVASFADSVLGAGLQAQYRCSECGKAIEHAAHCGKPALHVRGLRWMTNDAVNAAASILGAVFAWALLRYLAAQS